VATARPDFNRYLRLVRAPDGGLTRVTYEEFDAGTRNQTLVRARGPVNITSHIVYGGLDKVQIGAFF
jgi:hypothetical protein